MIFYTRQLSTPESTFLPQRKNGWVDNKPDVEWKLYSYNINIYLQNQEIKVWKLSVWAWCTSLFNFFFRFDLWYVGWGHIHQKNTVGEEAKKLQSSQQQKLGYSQRCVQIFRTVFYFLFQQSIAVVQNIQNKGIADACRTECQDVFCCVALLKAHGNPTFITASLLKVRTEKERETKQELMWKRTWNEKAREKQNAWNEEQSTQKPNSKLLDQQKKFLLLSHSVSKFSHDLESLLAPSLSILTRALSFDGDRHPALRSVSFRLGILLVFVLDEAGLALPLPRRLRSGVRRICFRVPTNRSSTLWFRIADTSMYLASKDSADRRPSGTRNIFRTNVNQGKKLLLSCELQVKGAGDVGDPAYATQVMQRTRRFRHSRA